MQYSSIVLAQGEDALEPLEILESKGEMAAVEYLKQWETGEEVPEYAAPWGEGDRLFFTTWKHGARYVLTWHRGGLYIGLTREER